MDNYNRGGGLYRERMLAVNLAKEIDFKNQKLMGMELKMYEILVTNQKLVAALEEQADFKGKCLLAAESKYHERCETIVQLKNEIDRLRGLMNEKDMLCETYFKETQRLMSINNQLKGRMMLIEETGKRQKEELHDEIIQQQKKLEAIQVLEVEVEQLKGALNATKHIKEEDGDGDGDGVELRKKMNEVPKDLAEKEEELDHLQALNQTLIVKERESNVELQEARKELIMGLSDMLTKQSTLQIRQMWAVDPKPFQAMCLEKFPHENWNEMSAKLCSKWEEEVRDTDWHPFKQDVSRGKPQVSIDECDKRLKRVRDEYGEAVHKAVADALLEMNEYNPSGRYTVPEVWKVKEGRKASLKEIVEYLIKQLKAHKRKRKRT